LKLVRKDGVQGGVAVHEPQRHANAIVCIRADIAAGEAPRSIPQTDAIALIEIGKDGIQGAVAVHEPQRHVKALVCIRADIAAGEAPGPIPQTDAIALS
jgi:hypothetical protein